MENYNLGKKIWTDVDFNIMGWHDCKIYAISFFDWEKFELALDIDYIFKWIKGNGSDNYFKFWIAPATLVFKNVYDINVSINSTDFRIDEIVRSNPVRPKNIGHVGDVFEYEWMVETSSGDINFKSVGYLQFIRQKPNLSDSQLIDIKERGGISFERITY
jgi:hypothetical protein